MVARICSPRTDEREIFHHAGSHSLGKLGRFRCAAPQQLAEMIAHNGQTTLDVGFILVLAATSIVLWLGLSALRIDGRLQQKGHAAHEIEVQNSRMKVLFDRRYCFSAPVLHLQLTFITLVSFFDTPTQVKKRLTEK